MKEILEKQRKKERKKKKQFVQKGVKAKPRLVVCRSLKHLSIQAIDDLSHTTLCQVSTTQKDIRKKIGNKYSNNEIAKSLGKIFGEKLKELKVEKAVFDRNGLIYHGNIKFLVDSIRETGIKI